MVSFKQLFVISIALSVTAGVALSTDARCTADAAYVCPPEAADFAPLKSSDPTTCSSGTECPACLTGAVWQERIAGLKATAPRALEFYLMFNNWLSAELTDTIAKILLKEVMGYSPVAVSMPVDGNMDVLCCDKMMVEFEKWPSGTWAKDDADGQFDISTKSTGYEGGSGLFVPDFFYQQHPLATASNAYKFLADYKHLLPAAGSTPCEKLIVDADLGCVAGNYICDKNSWATTTCTDGRYVPPQCVGNADCQEIYLADPTWDKGRFEALVKNTGLNFTIAYLGYTGMGEMVLNKTIHQEPFVFYWWKPDPLPASVSAQEITFVPNSAECEAGHIASKGDPAASGYDCGYPTALLKKLARRADLAKDKDFEFFFDAIQFGSSEIDAMLKQHVAANGTKQVYDLSCGWVKDNFATWREWTREYVDPNAVVGAAAADTTPLIAGVAAAAVVAVGAAVVAAAVLMRGGAAKSNEHAPKAAPLALIFTDVESSTMLWERFGEDMGKAMEVHHTIIREVIDEFNCYEVKVIGDAFMIACPTVLDATMLCLEVQRRLHASPDWPSALRYWKEGEGVEDPGLWNGLRVRMGLHHCTDIEAKYDTVHHGYDYYGPDVNFTARVQSVANGGQVTMSVSSYEALSSDQDYQDLVAVDCDVTRVSNGVALKGIEDKVPLVAIAPVAFTARQFPAIEGFDANMDVESAKDDPFEASMSCSESAFGSSGANNYAILSDVFKAVPNAKQKQAFLDTACEHYAIRRAPFNIRVKLLYRKLEQKHNSERAAGAFMVGASANPRRSSSMNRSLPGRPPVSPGVVRSTSTPRRTPTGTPPFVPLDIPTIGVHTPRDIE
jgi:class 3 adenylate cyclase/ABC-type proline/glycine betaine transport system substrate-binding protein